MEIHLINDKGNHVGAIKKKKTSLCTAYDSYGVLCCEGHFSGLVCVHLSPSKKGLLQTNKKVVLFDHIYCMFITMKHFYPLESVLFQYDSVLIHRD